MVVLAEHVDLARHAGAVAQPLVDEDATLPVELSDLAEVVDAIHELGAGRMTRRHAGQLRFDGLPHWHGIDAYAVARQARDEHIRAVRVLHERAKAVRDLQASFFINLGGRSAPE